MFLGLDFGTSGARSCVIDAQQSLVWSQRISYPNAASQTPLVWRTALHALLSTLPKDIASQLQGLAIDGTSASVLLCDQNLQPVSAALLYNDRRAHVQALQIQSYAPAGLSNATSGLAKFLWLTQQDDQPRAAYFMHQADWLTAMLSGQPGVSDYHNALKTGYDIALQCWPDWLVALPHAQLLPTVLTPGAVIGTLLPDLAAHFGINTHCLVHAGTTDSVAAFIASGVNEVGVGVTSLGTTLVVKQLSPLRIDAPEYGVYSHRFGEMWLVGGASNAGGGVLRHYFDDTQLATLSAQIDALQDSPLDYYPLPRTGERFPVNDAQLPPRLEPRPTDNVEFLHGLLQGLTRIEAAGYARLATLGAPPLRHVVSCGGGATNKVWRNLRARVLGLPVSQAKNSEAAYGSAQLAARPV